MKDGVISNYRYMKITDNGAVYVHFSFFGKLPFLFASPSLPPEGEADNSILDKRKCEIQRISLGQNPQTAETGSANAV